MADPGFCTIVAQLADPKFPYEIRCSSKNQYLKKITKKYLFFEGFAMLESEVHFTLYQISFRNKT